MQAEDNSIMDKLGESEVLQQHYNMEEVIFLLLQRLHTSSSECFATTLWSLWKSRNTRLWSHVDETSNRVSERANRLL